MLALSPSMFVWPMDPLEDLMSYEQSVINIDIETNSDESLFMSLPNCDKFVMKSSEVNGDKKNIIKKFHHNASERDRRKKVNNLYSSLRSLISTTEDPMKKLSIPSTISRALKYIPELQREVEKLDQKKEELMSRVDVSRKWEYLEIDQVIKKQRRSESSLNVVWINMLEDNEVVMQLCIDNKADKSNIRVSRILMTLEDEGLSLLNISCFESFGDRIFYNLHLQVQATQNLNLDILKKRLLSTDEMRL